MRFIISLFAFALLTALAAGCSRPPEIKQDPDAMQKELDDLQKQRNDEWKTTPKE